VAFFGDILPSSKLETEWVSPDLFPIVFEDVSDGCEVALTWNYGPVGFYTHTDAAGAAALDA
jgi:hypothetical protein